MQFVKQLILVITIIAAATVTGAQTPNPSVENLIRQHEGKQVLYLLSGNLTAMEKDWSPDYTVNNPFYKIVNARRGPVRSGQLTYSRFERRIENIRVQNRTAVVMGAETVVPDGRSPDAGKVINRRFTNVWMKKRGRWQMFARHASPICSN
jgi:hypothetical protein